MGSKVIEELKGAVLCYGKLLWICLR